MEQALHAGPEVHEGPELAHGGDAPGQHRADDDRSPDLGGVHALLLLEERAPRDDEIPAAFLVLDDAECVDVAFVLGGSGVPDVDLRHRAEGALMRDSHLVSALDRAFDLAFHRKARVERVFELPIGRGPAGQLPRERDPSPGRDHDRLNAVAGSDFEIAIGVLQFGDVDDGLALAADVDKRHLWTDRDDGALDGLTLLEVRRLD